MVKLDKINANILQALSQDGRISNIELADKVGLSPSACLRRVQELETHGVITGYRAVLNPEKMGRGFLAYITVGLSDHSINLIKLEFTFLFVNAIFCILLMIIQLLISIIFRN